MIEQVLEARGLSARVVLRIPHFLATFDVKQFWHERLHADPAHRWFRRVMVSLFKDAPEA